jgi:type VI secretion system protein ImpE
MNAKELIKAGRLGEARKALIEGVKASPADMGNRTLLFQIQAIYGEWEKAERQLDVIAGQDPKAEIGVQVYKNLVAAEKMRMDALNGNSRPSFVPKTPPYVELYYAACEKLGAKKFGEAVELFDQINEQRPVISGTLNGRSFTGFGDADVTLSFYLEAIVHDKYVWIPVESLRELTVAAPKTFFDLLWIAARVTTWDGLAMSCYLPVMYPNSFLHEDDRVKLGRMTDWEPLGGAFVKGMGQHVFDVGDEEIPLLEMREVLFTVPEAGVSNEKVD